MSKLSKLTTIILYIFIIITILSALSPLKKKIKNILPVSLGYVYSGSMEPTIRAGDGYILSNVKEYTVNDIITFKPKLLKDAYVTHRIIEVTEDNRFITKGDHNQSTDQEGGEPLVSKQQIVGKALIVNNEPISIPYLAGISSNLSRIIGDSNVFILISICIGIYLVGYIIDTLFVRKKRARRKHLRLIDIAPYVDPLFLTLCIIVFLNVAFITLTIKSWKPVEISYAVVSTRGVSSPIPGERFNKTMNLENLIPLPFVTIIEPERQGIEVEPKKVLLPWKQVVEYNLSIEAPQKIGYYTEVINKRTYIDILPYKWLDFLYSKGKFMPLIVILAPGIIFNIGLYIWWLKRWEVGTRKAMEWLIPFMRVLKRLSI